MVVSSTPFITVFTSETDPLTKRFTLQSDGTIQKEALATFYNGKAEAYPAESASALQAVLADLTSHQAISTGRPKSSDRVSIGVRGKLKTGQVSRSLSAFEFQCGPGWLVWDYDDKTMPPGVAQRIANLGGPLEALFHIWPEAKEGSYLIRPSSSDGVTAPGRDPNVSAGLHGFFLIGDVSQSKPALENLQRRAWTEGLAWIALSKSGAQLERSIVDTAVGSPERLVFEAPPIVLLPLMRTPRAAIVHNGPSPLAVPTATADVTAKAREVEARVRQAIAPQARKAEADFLNKRSRAEAKRTGKSLSAATSSIREMMKGAILADDYLLQLKNGSWIRVGDLLDDPDRYDYLSLPDPIEGLEYGTDKATLLLTPRPDQPGDRPRLVSHAHGQRTIYEFARFQDKPEPDIPAVWEKSQQTRHAALRATTDTIDRWGYLTDASIMAERDSITGCTGTDAHGEPAAASTAINSSVINTDNTDTTAERPDVTPVSPLVWLVSGAQGTGKTASVVGSLRDGVSTPGLMHEGIGYVTVLYSIDHAKSTEAYGDYVAARPANRPSPRPLQVRGMGALRQDGQGTMCAFADAMTRAAAQGVDVKGQICPGCPERDACPLMMLEKDIQDARHAPEGAALFAVHDHAFTRLPGGIEPSRVIFDERVRDFGHRTYAVPVAEWDIDLSTYVRWHRQRADVTADQFGALSSLIDPLKAAIYQAVIFQTADALTVIAAAADALALPGETAVDVVNRAAKELQSFDTDCLTEKLKAEMRGFNSGQNATPTPSMKAQLKTIVNATEVKHVKSLIGLFKVVAVELAQDHGPQLRSVLRATMHSDDCIVAEAIARTTIPDNVPVLHLDGTADPDLAKAWFGPDLERFHYPVERLTKDVVFVDGRNFSTTSLTGLHYLTGEPWNAERAAQTRDRWKVIFCQYPGCFIAMPKSVCEAFGDLPGHNVAHFGAVRGRNMAADCETGIVVGRNLPKPRELERLARAFAVALNRPFEALRTPNKPEDIRLPRRVEGLRMRVGPAHGIEVEYHPDPTAQAILRQIRDAEAAQAIDRVRAHFKPKRFIVAGACIPDITFDRM